MTIRRYWRWAARCLLWLLAATTIWWSWDRGRPYREKIQLRLDVKVEAAPLIGRLVWSPSPTHLVPLIIGALIIMFWPRVSLRLSFGWASTVAAAMTGAFAVSLAATGGWSRIMDPVVDPTEYWVNLDTLPSMSQTVSSWSDWRFLLDYTTHLKGHPPGFIVLLQAMEAIGLGQPWVVAAISWLSLAAVTPGVMTTVRALTDEHRARASAPFLAVAPFAIWMATSADAFFACVLVWGTACLAAAGPMGGRRKPAALAVSGGLLLAFGLFCSYGAAVFMIIPLAVLLAVPKVNSVRRIGIAMSSATAALVVTGIFWAAGFWWFDGLTTTKDFYNWGTAQFRPQNYFVVANIAALLVALGPAFVAGLARVGKTRLWALTGAATFAVAAADLSGYSKSEVERIWLIFMPFLLTVTTTLPRPRVWLFVQLIVAVGLQAWLQTKW